MYEGQFKKPHAAVSLQNIKGNLKTLFHLVGKKMIYLLSFLDFMNDHVARYECIAHHPVE